MSTWITKLKGFTTRVVPHEDQVPSALIGQQHRLGQSAAKRGNQLAESLKVGWPGELIGVEVEQNLVDRVREEVDLHGRRRPDRDRRAFFVAEQVGRLEPADRLARGVRDGPRTLPDGRIESCEALREPVR